MGEHAKVKDRIRPAVYQAVSDVLDISESAFTDESLIVEELEADSMNVVTMLILIEESLDTELDIAELPVSGVTVGHVIERLERRLVEV